MKFWKLGLALSLTAAFGITACDDSSSADEKKIGELYTMFHPIYGVQGGGCVEPPAYFKNLTITF